MNRRQFTQLTAALPAVQSTATKTAEWSALPLDSWRGTRILFLDPDSLAQSAGVAYVAGPVRKLGPVLRGDSAGDRKAVIAAMGCGLLRNAKNRFRLFYSSRSFEEPTSTISIAESDDGLTWDKPKLGQVMIKGEDTNRIRIEGLPELAHYTQPSVVPLDNGRFRMYFWLHVHRPRRLGRYLAAESDDALHWKVVNLDNPCLRHPWDLGKWGWLDAPESAETWESSGAPDRKTSLAWLRIRSNDATLTYRDPHGEFEMFTVWPLPNKPDSGRYVAFDNAHFALRVVTRRTSEDGLRWSDPEFLLTPDEADPWDQQFYYLAQHRTGPLRLGFAGHYRVHDQTIDIELLTSRDGLIWRRPLRGAWFPRGPEGAADSKLIYMPAHLLDRGDHWLALYTAGNTVHNEYAKGVQSVHGLSIPRYRFAGLTSSGVATARLLTRPFFLSGPALYLDATCKGAARAELCDAFGRPLPGLTFADCEPVRGDSSQHELRWKSAKAATYQCFAVSLRLEWTEGVVYGLHSPPGSAP